MESPRQPQVLGDEDKTTSRGVGWGGEGAD